MNFAVFGAGCFWCIEAIFGQLKGVTKVISGYTGGNIENPTYEQICSGTTGHAEVCKIIYNQKIISFETLIKVFFENHDPTTLNKQGNDSGTQYRSAIFYINDKQKELSDKFKKLLNNSKEFNGKIVTEITKLDVFYKAEDYHQNYYTKNPNQPYCLFVIKPKLDKFFNREF